MTERASEIGLAEATARPLRLVPRLDAKVWGGRRLEQFGQRLPPEVAVGEALATAWDSVIADGPFAGETLQALVERDPLAICGEQGLAATGGKARFPLLVKLIDAQQYLSIQLHPDDAAAPPGEVGKTETWHVLAADAGARLAMGLRPGVTGEEFAAACRAGERTASLLRWLPARPGTTFLIPAGTVHALGPGCLVYEAQQPSEITYRLDDWGRLDEAGRSRPLHVEVGLACLAADSRPEPIAPMALRSPVGRRHLLVACAYFAVERVALAAGEVAPVRAVGSPQTLTCLRGAAEVQATGGTAALAAGETAILSATAGSGSLRAVTPAVVFRAWVPDVDDATSTGVDLRSDRSQLLHG